MGTMTYVYVFSSFCVLVKEVGVLLLVLEDTPHFRCKTQCIGECLHHVLMVELIPPTGPGLGCN